MAESKAVPPLPATPSPSLSSSSSSSLSSPSLSSSLSSSSSSSSPSSSSSSSPSFPFLSVPISVALERLREISAEVLVQPMKAELVSIAMQIDELGRENKVLYALVDSLLANEAKVPFICWKEEELYGFILLEADKPGFPLTLLPKEQLQRIKILAKVRADFLLGEGRAENLYVCPVLSDEAAEYLLVNFGATMTGDLLRNLEQHVEYKFPIVRARAEAFFTKFPEKKKAGNVHR